MVGGVCVSARDLQGGVSSLYHQKDVIGDTSLRMALNQETHKSSLTTSLSVFIHPVLLLYTCTAMVVVSIKSCETSKQNCHSG